VTLVWVLSLPGVVCLLIVLAALERCGLTVRRGGRGVGSASGSPLAAIGMDELGALLTPAKHHELEYRRSTQLRRQDQADGAPPRLRVDLDRGVASVDGVDA
jgi:hypothetical protein